MDADGRAAGLLGPAPLRLRRKGLGGTAVVAVTALLVGLVAGGPARASVGVRAPTGAAHDRATQAASTGSPIKHVVVVELENHSFDNYFGSFPGANGIAAGTCVPLPQGGCQKPLPHFPALGVYTHDLPHDGHAQATAIDGGKMDGFLRSEQSGCACSTDLSMGYFDLTDIPTFWRYAKRYTIADNFFEQVDANSYGSHLAMVSEWAATCSSPTDPLSCSPNPALPWPKWKSWPAPGATLPWTDLTYLMYTHGVSWGYYNADGTQPVCSSTTSCTFSGTNSATIPIWNPLPWFTDVAQDAQLSNITDLDSFYSALAANTLPAVSWVLPSAGESGHPAISSNPASEAWVGSVLDAVESSPEWSSTVVFLGWDDFGGEYDHVPPSALHSLGLGIRVPEMVISPYSKSSYVDHQLLSLDAVNRFVEDNFLGGQRLDPATDGRPDSRPQIWESSPQLGSVAADLDFSQKPAAPMLVPLLSLPPTAVPGAAVTVTGSHYKPGDTVTLVFDCGAPNCKTGTVVGSATVQGGGTFAATFTVPASAPAGETWLSAMGSSKTIYFGIAGTNVTTPAGIAPPVPTYPPTD